MLVNMMKSRATDHTISQKIEIICGGKLSVDV